MRIKATFRITSGIVAGLFAVLLSSLTLHAQDVDAVAKVQSNKMNAIQWAPAGDVVTPPAGQSFLKIGRNVGTNMMVSDPQLPFPDGYLGRSETIIASDPSGNFLVAGWNDAEGFCGPPLNRACPDPPIPGLSGYGYSADGGATWTDGGTPPTLTDANGLTWYTRGDPWFDSGGPGQKTYYFANLAIVLDDASTYGLQGMLVHRGKFQGKNFSFNHVTVIPPTKANGADVYDKESLAAGKTGSTKNMVAVAVTNFIEVFGIPQWGWGQIEVYTSFDQAGSFANHAIVQPDESIDEETGTVNQGAAVAIGAGGEIYVTCERGWGFPLAGSSVTPQIVFAKSMDGGQTFTPRTVVSEISSAMWFPPTGYNRGTTNDFPRIAVSTGEEDPYNGRIYVAYQDSRIANSGPQSITGGFGNGDTDIYLRWSDDGGSSWSAATLIAAGPHQQFWPAVDVQPDGTVDVVWYDNDGNGLTDVYYAGSDDGGATFSAPLLVTAAPTDWTGTPSNIIPNFGDYIGIFSTQNRTQACWGDGTNGYPAVFVAPVAYGTPKSPGSAAVSGLELAQNYPNPFNPSTTIAYTIAESGHVVLKVYNAVGKEVATLVDGLRDAGTHRLDFDASELPGGMYMYRVTVGETSISRGMMLIK